MFDPIKKTIGRTFFTLVAGVSLAAFPLAVRAATYTYTFNNTSLGINVGPNNPSSGAVAFYGTNLVAGDILRFDGIVIDNNPSTQGDWGAVNFNGAGTGGLTSATLGVMARDGTHVAANYLCSVWTGGSSVNVGFNPTPATNRILVQITCEQTGTTTNMNYEVDIDQGVTGTFNVTQTGTGLTFPNNVVPLSFGTRNEPHTFIQNQPTIAATNFSPTNLTAVVGATVTFNGALTAGWPVSVTEQWYSNNVAIPNATNVTYTTPALDLTYNGAQYYLVVSNQLNSANVITSSVSKINVRTGPGFVTFNFPEVTTVAGYGPVTDPGVSISGSSLLAGDTVVFDGILIPNGGQPSDAWTAINIAGAGYGNVTSAQLGVLCRQGTGPSQLFINGSGSSNPTAGGAATNRVRIELYPSVNGSTTNMGWLVEIDQNLSGTFQPAVTGTNLTFPNNTLPLTFGSSGGSSFVIQNPESPVSIFSGPNPSFQAVAAGAPITVGVNVEGWYPAFQWRKNGVAIPNATNETYTIASASTSDNGDRFTVVVSNKLNSANVATSAVANVSVLIPNNLSWYPAVDYTTWDSTTLNWTTNGGTSEIAFSSGNNVTFDSLGYNLGGSSVTLTNTVSPNAVTVNTSSGVTYVWSGAGNISGQSLQLNGDGSGNFYMDTTATFGSANISANTTLGIGTGGADGLFQANFITNNGTIQFQDSGLLNVSGVITGSGSVLQSGTGTTVLSATNSAYTIQAVYSGALVIASTPNPGSIENDAEIQPNSAASVLAIPNVITGSGHYAFTGFQTTILTGASTFTGANRLPWSRVIVDNAQALGDPSLGLTSVTGADNVGGLYLSNNVDWVQNLTLNPRLNAGNEATAPHLANWSGPNIVDSQLTFATGQGGSELNIEVTTGQLTINSTLVNNAGNNTNNLNLQGAGVGIWNGILNDGAEVLNVLKRGPGAWTFAGANTYSGTTTVSNGTLLVNGQLGTGAVSVLTGATLGGVGGTIAGPVTVQGGGALSVVGGGTNILTITNNLTLLPGSVTSVEINKTAHTNDQIAGITNLTYGGTLAVTNLAGTLTTNDSFRLFYASSYSGGFSAVTPSSPGSGLSWNTNTLLTDGTLRLAAVLVNTNSTNIMATLLGGNTLQLSWPLNQIGWTLESNSQNISVAADWIRVTGSAQTNTVNSVVNTNQPGVFFRLVYP